jgi:hypothetical protein
MAGEASGTRELDAKFLLRPRATMYNSSVELNHLAVVFFNGQIEAAEHDVH